MTQLYMHTNTYIKKIPFSIIVYHRILNIVLCAKRWTLLFIHSIYKNLYQNSLVIKSLALDLTWASTPGPSAGTHFLISLRFLTWNCDEDSACGSCYS